MSQQISGEDRIVLGRLQSELAQRFDGALDGWTLVCLAPVGMMPCPHDFVSKQVDILRSLAIVLQAVVATAVPFNREGVFPLLEAIIEDCQELGEVFGVLEEFRARPLPELRTATNTLAQLYTRFWESLRVVDHELGGASAYLQSRTPERVAYYQGILDGLFDLLHQARIENPQTVDA